MSNKMRPKRRVKTKHLKKSKSPDFLERFKKDQSMVEYLTQLRIMNPAAERNVLMNKPRREGRFVRLAHARDEFEAPKLSHGKSVETSKKK